MQYELDRQHPFVAANLRFPGFDSEGILDSRQGRAKLFQTTTLHVQTLSDGSVEYEIALVADMDQESRVAGSLETWWSCLRRGRLRFHPGTMEFGGIQFGEDVNLLGQFNFGGKGMELSELCIFDGHLLTVDDQTGLVYRIEDLSRMVPWVFLNDGAGNSTRGFKGEWMATKDGLLYVGSHGREKTAPDGSVVHHNRMFVKVVTPSGEVRHEDWAERFKALRRHAGIHFPGYVTHEACQWSSVHQKWFFLPRKASPKLYSPEGDAFNATNMLMTADSEFAQIEVHRVGRIEGGGTRGFSSFQFLPGTDDEVALCVKSVEVEGRPVESYLFMFRLRNAQVLLEDLRLEGAFKFEGLVVY